MRPGANAAILRSKVASRVTACVSMTGNKKARRDAGLFDACGVRPDRPIERMLLDRSRAYLASLLGELGDLRGEPRDFAAGIVLVNDVSLGGAHQGGLGVRQRRH